MSARCTCSPVDLSNVNYRFHGEQSNPDVPVLRVRSLCERAECSRDGLVRFALNMVEMTELLMERKADYSQVCCSVFVVTLTPSERSSS